jgi:hypothetical protein
MIKLPITENELEMIMSGIKSSNPQLYAKLWSYKFNVLNKKEK